MPDILSSFSVIFYYIPALFLLQTKPNVLTASQVMPFTVVGLNYKKADAHIRGLFSLDQSSKINLIKAAKAIGLKSLCVISTCNRTEIYAGTPDEKLLMSLLCEYSSGDLALLSKVAYVYSGNRAVDHLFNVGSGLDSQILGDFEIIGQLKNSARLSKEHGLVDAHLERLINSVLQASKRIKNLTQLSSGATSVSFAAVQYILANVNEVSSKNILLFGTGKIGRNTCENLVKHTQNQHITLINRTKSLAEKVAGKFNLMVKEYSQLQEVIRDTDVLIVATGAQHPTVNKNILQTERPLLILDLSIPRNVDENVQYLGNIALLHLDDLSQITDDAIEMRQKEVPKAQIIIEEIKQEFYEWCQTRRFVPTLRAFQDKLHQIKAEELNLLSKKGDVLDSTGAELISDQLIQKITNHLAHHLRNSNVQIEDQLQLIQSVFQLNMNSND